MATFSDEFYLRLETQHVLALRKALAVAVIADEQLPESERKLTPPDRVWIAQVERQLWPGWRPAHERRHPNPT